MGRAKGEPVRSPQGGSEKGGPTREVPNWGTKNQKHIYGDTSWITLWTQIGDGYSGNTVGAPLEDRIWVTVRERACWTHPDSSVCEPKRRHYLGDPIRGHALSDPNLRIHGGRELATPWGNRCVGPS